MWKTIDTILTQHNVTRFNRFYYKTKQRRKEIPVIGSQTTLILKTEEKKRRKDVLIPLLKTHSFLVFFLFILKLATTLLIFIGPVVLDWMITFVKSPTEPDWTGYLFALMLFFSSMITSLVGNHSQYYSNLIRIKLRASLANTIYVKVWSYADLCGDPTTRYSVIEFSEKNFQFFVKQFRLLYNSFK